MKLDARIANTDQDGLDDGRTYAALKPGFIVRGYRTHGFTFGPRSEYREKLKLIEVCDCEECRRRK